MTEMSMNRAIHGAFRRDLARFVDALRAFPPGDLTRAQQLSAAWENFVDQLTHHHHGEHEIAWPALQSVGVSPELLQQMDAEHDVMAKALDQARTAMAELVGTAGITESKAALSALQYLQTVTIQHLDHEEAELEPVFLAKRDTPEIKAMGRKFGQVSPVRGGRFFEWIMDGATAEERATVKDNVPGPVLKVIGAVFGRGYRKNIAPVWR